MARHSHDEHDEDPWWMHDPWMVGGCYVIALGFAALGFYAIYLRFFM